MKFKIDAILGTTPQDDVISAAIEKSQDLMFKLWQWPKHKGMIGVLMESM